MDYLLWDYATEEVYNISSTTEDDMKYQTGEVFDSFKLQMLRNVSESFTLACPEPEN